MSAAPDPQPRHVPEVGLPPALPAPRCPSPPCHLLAAASCCRQRKLSARRCCVATGAAAAQRGCRAPLELQGQGPRSLQACPTLLGTRTLLASTCAPGLCLCQEFLGGPLP